MMTSVSEVMLSRDRVDVISTSVPLTLIDAISQSSLGVMLIVRLEPYSTSVVLCTSTVPKHCARWRTAAVNITA